MGQGPAMIFKVGWVKVKTVLPLSAVAGIEMGNKSNGGQERDLTQNHLESPSDPGKHGSMTNHDFG